MQESEREEIRSTRERESDAKNNIGIWFNELTFAKDHFGWRKPIKRLM